MTSALRILIVGGYGTFGGRLVSLLEDEPRLTLIVAGRNLQKAQRFCVSRAARAQLVPAFFDRDGDLDCQLAALMVDIVVDASGPFQDYGHRLVEACIARQISYIDLADSPEFVSGIARFDPVAVRARVFAISGVSTLPALSSAVIRHLAQGYRAVTSVCGGIAPSPRAGVGENVIRAMAAQAGQRASGYAFTAQIRRTIGLPGHSPLRDVLFSRVSVPDDILLQKLFPEIRHVWFGAGPSPEVLHWALIGCAWLVRLRILPTLSPLAHLMYWATRRLRWGDHRGGMFVEVEGMDAVGALRKRAWHLVAEDDRGPFIPSIGVAILVRKALDGVPPSYGARPAINELSLADFEKVFAARGIVTGIREA